MPLPRKKDDATTGGAPILNIPRAHVKLFDVEEYEKPYAVERKRDGAKFTLDPGFNCNVEVLNDHRDGSDNGTRFFESFKYKQDRKTGKWFNKENSKLGSVTKVVKPGYFQDETISPLMADDLEGFEMICRVKPKKNPTNGEVVGSTIDWETMEALPSKRKKKPADREAAPAQTDAEPEDLNEDEWSDIPF